jgi:acetyl/propionyl-CoA carboxylase alpha subunit
MKYFVTIADRTLEVDLSGGTPTVDGTPIHAELVAIPATPIRHLIANGRSFPLTAGAGDRRGRWTLSLGAERFSAEALDERTRAIREMTGGETDTADRMVIAPMPGLVVKVEVEVGQQVKAGQGVVVVEAMKMENELKAPADGVVARVEVKPGQTVDKGATLIVLE